MVLVLLLYFFSGPIETLMFFATPLKKDFHVDLFDLKK